MNGDKILKWINVVALVVIAIALVFTSFSSHVRGSTLAGVSLPGYSGTPTTIGNGSVPTVFSALEATESFLSDGPSYMASSSAVNVTSSNTLLGKSLSSGSCNAATSTLFAVANPFAATSTVRLTVLRASTEATSTQLLVGTSTLATGLTSSLISPTLVNGTVATGTGAFAVSGVRLVTTGGTDAGANTSNIISVGPSEFVGAFATSTYSTSGSVNYTPLGSLASCTYKLEWNN